MVIDTLLKLNNLNINEATNPNDNIHFKVGDEFEYINEYDTAVKVKVIDTDGKVLTTEETFKDNDGKENTTKQTSKITVDGSGIECIVRTDRNGKPGYLYPPSRDSFKEFDLDESKSNGCLNEDHSERYRKGSYCATINTDAFEDTSFEDDYLPMDFDIRKGEEVIDTVRGLKNAKARIDDLVKQDQRARMDKWFIGFDDNSTYIKSGTTLETLFDRWRKANPGKRDEEYYEEPYNWITDDIEDAQLFSSYEEAEAFWYDQELMDVFADEGKPVSDYIHKISDMIEESVNESKSITETQHHSIEEFAALFDDKAITEEYLWDHFDDKDAVELEYDDIEYELESGREIEIYHSEFVEASEFAEYIFDNNLLEDIVPELFDDDKFETSDDQDDAIFKYIDEHFDELVDKFYDKALEYFRERAEEHARENFDEDEYERDQEAAYWDDYGAAKREYYEDLDLDIDSFVSNINEYFDSTYDDTVLFTPTTSRVATDGKMIIEGFVTNDDGDASVKFNFDPETPLTEALEKDTAKTVVESLTYRVTNTLSEEVFRFSFTDKADA